MEPTIEKPIQAAAIPLPPLRIILIPDILLAIQFLLGMYINLFVEFPKTGPMNEWKFTLHNVVILAHIAVGTTILVLTVMSLIQFVKMKNQRMIRFGVVGLSGVLLAVIGGVTFITTQVDLFSYVMALGFITGVFVVNISFITQLLFLRASQP